jgi:hypothetical protein
MSTLGLNPFSRLTWWTFLLLGIVLFPVRLPAETLSLKIKVLNPSLEERTKIVSSQLPKRIKPENINELGGLELKYDPENQVYFVFGEITLQPREQRIFTVEIEDIWVIPPSRFEELTQHVDQLSEKLKESRVADQSKELHEAIIQKINNARQMQQKSSTSVVPVLQHMQAYESNLELLKKARLSIGQLEDLALSAGIDPGQIHGLSAAPLSGEDDRGLPPASQTTAMMYIKAINPAGVDQKINLKRYLPKEIKQEDIVNSGGLQVAYDDTQNAAYLYLNDIELGPSGEKVFQVEVKNRWTIHPGRISSLYDQATNILAVSSRKSEYASIVTKVESLLKELSTLKQMSPPATMSGDYIAHYHDMSSRLDEVEKGLLLLADYLNPETRPSDDMSDGEWVKADSPDSESILLVIYIIAGFLGLVGFIFLIRWISASKK